MTVDDLMDAEGENQAVRAFLMLYGGAQGVTVDRMRYHLSMSGFDCCWPSWTEDQPEGAHLTKAGAQLWLRHLFDLEAARRQPDAGVVVDPWTFALCPDDVKRLRAALTWMGRSSPESMEECCARQDDLILELIRAVEQSKRAWGKSTPPASPVPASVRAAILEEAIDAIEGAKLSRENAEKYGAEAASIHLHVAAIRALASQAAPTTQNGVKRYTPVFMWNSAGKKEFICWEKREDGDWMKSADVESFITGLLLDQYFARNAPVEVVPEQRCDSTEVKGGADAVDGERYRVIRAMVEKEFITFEPADAAEFDALIDAIAAESEVQGENNER